MKKLIIAAAIGMCSLAASAQQSGSVLNKGMVAVYTVYLDGNMAYNFVVRFNGIGNSVYGDYTFAQSGRGDYGTFYIDEYTLDSATSLKNYYGTGAIEFMGNQTGIVASRLMFDAMNQVGKSFTLDMDGTPVQLVGDGLSSVEFGTNIRRNWISSDTSFLVVEDYGYDVIMGFNMVRAYSADNSYIISVLNHRNFPMILEMITPEFEIRLNALM